MRTLLATVLLFAWAAGSTFGADGQFTVHKRSRVAAGAEFQVKETAETWAAGQTAIIVCDMWDSHHCLNAVRRAVEMAPRMNEVLKTAREQGVLIIHAPSSCMEPYKDHPGRKLAQSAPKAANLPADIGQWCRADSGGREGQLPDRPDRRRRGRRPGRARSLAREAGRPGPQSQVAVEEPDRPARRSTTTTRSATAASRSGTCSKAAASRTSSCSACTRTCASSAGRSACGRWPRTARTSC